MNLTDLIGRGYFPKELPPPFTTKKYSHEINNILSAWQVVFEKNTDVSNAGFILTRLPAETSADFKSRKKAHASAFKKKYNSSRSLTYSISKGKLSRRFLQIPNPKHFALLCERISINWSTFESLYTLSDYSKSYPIIENDTNKRSVSTLSKSVSDFRNHILLTSEDKLIEIKVDISKFYPTIYTHSVAWALLGKEKAKEYFAFKDSLSALIAAGDSDALLYKEAELIDMAVRNCQERQSIGIPIGPDTSHIIAEAVACRIDNILKTKFSTINFSSCRYYDDFYIYVNTRDDADKMLKGLQLILSEFQLEINESKVKIRDFPFAFEDEFASILFLFDFKETNLENSLKHYFSVIWGLAEKNQNKADWIFKYSLRRFEFGNSRIPSKNWRLFESLLFKTALIEPSILDIVTRILLSYKSFINPHTKEKLKNLISTIIREHSPLRHNFEVSWALWVAKTFEITVNQQTAEQVLEIKDSISNLILLDLIRNTTLVEGTPDVSKLATELTDGKLFSDSWLLAYESVKKRWLTPPSSTFLTDNLFFNLMESKDIEFYDTSKQLTPYFTSDNAQKRAEVAIENQGETIVIDEDLDYYEETLEELFDYLPSGLDY